jgi:hypothetical protein
MPALIDTVTEDPLNFFLLDLKTGSYTFSELADNGTVEFKRAKYTLEILRLNTRPFLTIARAEAYKAYKARLKEYIHDRENETATEDELNEMIKGIREASHPTVWQEMKRQRNFIPELGALFARAAGNENW